MLEQRRERHSRPDDTVILTADECADCSLEQSAVARLIALALNVSCFFFPFSPVQLFFLTAFQLLSCYCQHRGSVADALRHVIDAPPSKHGAVRDVGIRGYL